jgi:hypothetical protein
MRINLFVCFEVDSMLNMANGKALLSEVILKNWKIMKL